jgi:aminopeptidase
MTFQEKLEQYAQLAAKVGANVQKGQYLLINTSTETLEFTRLVVKAAYEAGAGRVHVNLTDDFVTRAFYEHGSEEELLQYPKWIVEQREELIAKKGALLWIDAEDPDLLSGIDHEKLAKQQKAGGEVLKNYRKAVMNDDIAWSIVAVPSKKWAAKVFPNLAEEEQVPALWEAIFASIRIGEGDAVALWRAHIEALETRARILNEKGYVQLRYKAPGTDLSIDLPKGHIWQSGSSKAPNGTVFIANMPTEEVFTLPAKYGVNGTVRNTKPLAYRGNVIDDFTLTFKDGKVIEAHAGVGNELLQSLLTTDETSSYLGEVALVPHNSPISNSNILYFNTLFDENASNHLAFGAAYPTCFSGGRDLTEDQLEAKGINVSVTHEDFMIGSADMDIDGVLEDGTVEPVFRKGNWAF